MAHYEKIRMKTQRHRTWGKLREPVLKGGEMDFLKDLLQDAILHAHELRCRLDTQPDLIGLADIILSRVEQVIYCMRSSGDQVNGNDNNNLRVL